VYTAAQPAITSVGTLANLSVSGVTTLGNIGNLRISGGGANFLLQTDGSGNITWVNPTNALTITAGDMTVDNFTASGVQSVYGLSVTPDNIKYVSVNIDGVSQLRQSFSISGTSLILSEAPVNGALIEVTTLIPGHVTTASLVTNPAQPIITSVGTLSSLAVTGLLQSGSLATTGALTVGGNFMVNGTTTIINATTLSITDLNITIAKDATTAASANGAGLTVAGAAAATILYNSSADTWDFNKTIAGNVTGSAQKLKTWSVTSFGNAVTTTSSGATVVTNMTLTPGAGTYLVSYNSQYTTLSLSNITASAASDLQTLYNSIMALAATNSIHAPAFGSGEVLSPGVYDIAAAASVAGTLTFDAGGNSSALFVIRCTGAFTTGAAATMVLTNGATSSNIWWISQGAASTGANTIFKGTLMTNQAGVSTGAQCQIEGRLLAVNGANAISSSILTIPTGNSVMPMGLVSLFSMFCAIGAPSNSGTSNVALSIGTNAGAITGFATATVAGSMYSAATATSNISFGIYANGVLVPDSERSQVQPAMLIGWPLALQTIVTLAAGQSVDVRHTALLGSFAIGPGMALVLIPIVQ